MSSWLAEWLVGQIAAPQLGSGCWVGTPAPPGQRHSPEVIWVWSGLKVLNLLRAYVGFPSFSLFSLEIINVNWLTGTKNIFSSFCLKFKQSQDVGMN